MIHGRYTIEVGGELLRVDNIVLPAGLVAVLAPFFGGAQATFNGAFHFFSGDPLSSTPNPTIADVKTWTQPDPNLYISSLDGVSAGGGGYSMLTVSLDTPNSFDFEFIFTTTYVFSYIPQGVTVDTVAFLDNIDVSMAENVISVASFSPVTVTDLDGISLTYTLSFTNSGV